MDDFLQWAHEYPIVYVAIPLCVVALFVLVATWPRR